MKRFTNDIINRHSKTLGERNEIDETLALPIFSQDVLGQNVLHPNWSWKTTMGRQIIFILSSIYGVLCSTDSLGDERDAASTNNAFFIALFTLLIEIKILLFINNRENFKQSYHIVKTALFDIVKSASVAQQEKLLKQYNTMVYMFIGCVILPLVGYMLNVAWHYFLLDTRVYLTAYSSLLPMTNPYYQIGLILQTVTYFVILIPCFVIDFWFVIFILGFCRTSESLVEMLKIEHGSDETQSEYMDRLNDTLRTFYGNHVKLVEYYNILNRMYKWQAVIPLLSAFATLCVLLFSFQEDVQWHFVLTHAIPVLFQISAYQLYGEQVISQGCQVHNALMEFDWTSMRLRDRNNYLIIIGYMNKEFRIKTALGNDLSLLTMSSLVKASYQACALLRTMND
uniref:Odorant receptor n=1 Tax=Heliothis virescens TaxID=7102 RepID=A0A2A4J660_HELVI